MLRAPPGSSPEIVEIVRQFNAELVAMWLRPIHMPTFLKTDLPDPVKFKDCWIKVSNETGGDTAAESDGTNWRRMQDRAIVS